MAQVAVVTDSTATFENESYPREYGIAIVPLKIQVGAKNYVEGKEIDSEEVLHRLRHTGDSVRITAPTVEEFETVYRALNKSTDQICVVVNSSQFTQTFEHAQAARSALLGRCEIVVIDSATTSAGLGYLVEGISATARDGANLDSVIHTARSTLPRLYSVFYVNSLDYIQRAGLIGKSQAILGEMLDIKPILTIEDGLLMTMEKARTHAQAIDRMMEFVTEFTQIERLCIMQSTVRSNDATRMLQDRLALEFGHTHHPLTLYSPLLATLMGPFGLGVALVEGSGGELFDFDDDDFDDF